MEVSISSFDLNKQEMGVEVGGRLGLSLTFIKDEIKMEIKFLHLICVSK